MPSRTQVQKGRSKPTKVRLGQMCQTWILFQCSRSGSRMPMTNNGNENHFGKDMVMATITRCTNEKDILYENSRPLSTRTRKPHKID